MLCYAIKVDLDKYIILICVNIQKIKVKCLNYIYEFRKLWIIDFAC